MPPTYEGFELDTDLQDPWVQSTRSVLQRLIRQVRKQTGVEDRELHREHLVRQLQSQLPAEDLQFHREQDGLLQCSICMDELPEDNVANVDGCMHVICLSCLREFVSLEIQEHRYPIFCPVCTAETDKNTEPSVVSRALMERLGVSAEQFQILAEMEPAEFTIQIHCHQCRRPAFVDREDYADVSNIECPQNDCHHVWCKECGKTIDIDGANHSCEGSSELHHLVWKHCPNCTTLVLKEMGCNHMSCISPGCNTHLCYVCGGMIIRSAFNHEINQAIEQHFSVCDMFEHSQPACQASQQPQGPARYFECNICMDELPEDEVAKMDGCLHTMCRTCLKEFVSSKIQERQYPIFCPLCTAKTDKDGEPRTIPRTLIEQLDISEEQHWILTELEVAEFAIQIHCRKCQRSTFVDREDYTDVSNIECPQNDCHHVWCKECGQTIVMDGRNHTCDNPSEPEDWINERAWKYCPNCETPILKETGCNHMTCISPGCYTHFCYVCGDTIVRSALNNEIDQAVEGHFRRCQRSQIPNERSRLAYQPYQGPTRYFQCSICIDEQREDDVAKVEGCMHTMCRTCLREFVSSKIQEHRYPIYCPTCTAERDKNVGPSAISRMLIEQLGISEEQSQVLTELELAEFTIHIHCRKCQRSAFVDREDYAEEPNMACPQSDCDHVWCKKCEQTIVVEGPEHSCDGLSELEHLMKEQGWKHCPNCTTPILKETGCNHMMCISPGCNTHFCYNCGEMIVRSALNNEIDQAVEQHFERCQMFGVPD